MREKKRLTLSDVGQLVFSYCENIFGLSQEMLARLAGSSSGMHRLRIGSVSTMSRNYQENLINPLLLNPAVTLTLESGLLDDLLKRLIQHQLDIVFANEAVPVDPDYPLHCRFLGSQAVSLVGPPKFKKKKTIRVPHDLDGVDIAVPGRRHALRAQFDALCGVIGVEPRIRAEVDDMAMLRLIARDSGWLTVLPDVVVQDELRAGILIKLGQSSELRERFYAITTPRRHHFDLLEHLLNLAKAKH